jgi:hypothetical protein
MLARICGFSEGRDVVERPDGQGIAIVEGTERAQLCLELPHELLVMGTITSDHLTTLLDSNVKYLGVCGYNSDRRELLLIISGAKRLPVRLSEEDYFEALSRVREYGLMPESREWGRHVKG